MFRVPVNPVTPTFDDVTKVSFWKWLTSSRADRVEWARRRNAAAQTAGANQRARYAAYGERKEAERKAKRDQR